VAILEVLCPACARVHTFDGRVSFRAECEACAADLHVCLACRFYDRHVENDCREPTAEPVSVKDRRNLCELFEPRGRVTVDDTAIARAKLDALFGGKPAASTTAPTAPVTSSTRAVDDAKAKLEALFKKK
jgi:hypothetical protein